MKTSKDAKNGRTKARDDLQKIKGIGQSTEQVLNGLGIYRYKDLTAFDSASLTALLKGKIPSVSLQRVEKDDWVGQARLLDAEQQRASRQEPAAEAAPETAAVDMAGPPEADNWRELADFFVSFGYARDASGQERLQTKVYYSQGDRTGQWEGIAASRAKDWMLLQADLPFEREKASTGMLAPEVPPVPYAEPQAGSMPYQEMAEPTAEMQFSEVWVTEEKAPVPAHGVREPGHLHLESKLELSGQEALSLAEARHPFVVELYLVDTETTQAELVENSPGMLTPGVMEYTVRRDFPIPKAGRYQLYLIARLLPPSTSMTHLQGPVLIVE